MPAGNKIAGARSNKDPVDFYPTPTWVTAAILNRGTFEGQILECACGDGDMAKVMEKHGYSVQATDIRETGYGLGGIDFCMTDTPSDNIVTNPPFRYAEDFIDRAKLLADKKFAFFLRLAFLESQGRKNMFLEKTFPLSQVLVFSKRIDFTGEGGGMLAFAWFVWDREHTGSAVIDWL